MPRKGRNIYKRKDDRWEARVYFKGCKKYKAVYGKTYSEAAKKQDKLRLEMYSTDFVDYPICALAELWLENKRITVKEGTVFSYSTKLNKHILPYFSGIYFSKLNEKMMNAFVASKHAEGLSAKYISDMVVIVKSISAWAHKTYNTANNISNFKNLRQTPKEPELLNSDEQRKLQQYLLKCDSSISLGVFTDMFTGLRIGEICALKWSDIDFENHLIRVNKSVQRLPSGDMGKTEVKIVTPKTNDSVRIIPMPKFLAERLENHRKDDDCYLVSGSNKLTEPRYLRYKFKRILLDAGVPNVKFHSLRHSFSVNCIQNQFDIKTLSEILGHSSPNITLKMYLHSNIEQKRNCMERLHLL